MDNLFCISLYSVVASTCQDMCKRAYSYCREMQKRRRNRALQARGERAEEEEVEADPTSGGEVINSLDSFSLSLSLSLSLSCHFVTFISSIILITALCCTVRNRGYVAGSKIDDVLARTQYLLDNGLLLEAVKELVSSELCTLPTFSIKLTNFISIHILLLILCSFIFFFWTLSQIFPVTSIPYSCTTTMFNCIE